MIAAAGRTTARALLGLLVIRRPGRGYRLWRIGPRARRRRPGGSLRARALLPGQLPALRTARCGFLVVPENRSDPRGRTIRLAVAVVPAVAERPAPEPLVFLEGGPGGSAFLESQRLVDAGFNRDRDLILVDQRGTL